MNPERLVTDSIDFGPAVATGGTAVVNSYSPSVDQVIDELFFAAWDANFQPFSDENKASGNTPAGNAVPSLYALTLAIKEDGNDVPFQKPIRIALLASGGRGQRILKTPIRLFKNRSYTLTLKNDGPVNMLAAQWLLAFPSDK